MEEWYLKDIVSKLTITFLINHDLDKTYIFPHFDCWELLYCILQEDLQETEDDHHESKQYPFDHYREGYKKIMVAIPYMLIEKSMFVHVV